jgi:hypothetical protein
MSGNGYSIAVYTSYALVAVGLTFWLARTLSRNGAIFLEDVFEDRPGLAQSVNHLLVVGFYMLNLGWALFVIHISAGMDALHAVQFFVNRVAILLLVLALLHFVNVAVFWRIRSRREQRSLPVPVAPNVVVRPQPGIE